MDERTDPTTDILAAKQALRRGAIVGGAFIRRTTYDRLGQESQDTAAARNDVEAERSGWDDVTPVLGTTAVRPSVGAPEGTLYNGLHRIDPDPTGSLSPDTLRRDAHRQGPIW